MQAGNFGSPMTMRVAHLPLGLAMLLSATSGLHPAKAQSVQLFVAGHGQTRPHEPFMWGPLLGVRISDMPTGYALGLHAAWSKGRLVDRKEAYRLDDVLFRYGGSMEKRLHARGRVEVFAGISIEGFRMERKASGSELGWGQAHNGNGVIAGTLGRAGFQVGSITRVLLCVEPVYAFYSTTSGIPDGDVLRGRPLVNGFYLRGSLGLSFTFLPAE